MSIPKKIIIVPYRDRESHKKFFIKRMKDYFKDEDGIEMYFIHQTDKRSFNRGAMKNIGFLIMKQKYNKDYKNITFIFHDIDTLPRHNGIIPYDTKPGIVSHYYGTYFALGGIVAIKGIDFEKIKGFPNYWGWGMEDNMLQERCIKNNIIINRNNFFPMEDKNNIIRLFDGFHRVANTREPSIYKYEVSDTLNDIKQLSWVNDKEMLHIKTFKTGRPFSINEIRDWDIRKSAKMDIPKGQCRKNWSLNIFNT